MYNGDNCTGEIQQRKQAGAARGVCHIIIIVRYYNQLTLSYLIDLLNGRLNLSNNIYKLSVVIYILGSMSSNTCVSDKTNFDLFKPAINFSFN